MLMIIRHAHTCELEHIMRGSRNRKLKFSVGGGGVQGIFWVILHCIFQEFDFFRGGGGSRAPQPHPPPSRSVHAYCYGVAHDKIIYIALKMFYYNKEIGLSYIPISIVSYLKQNMTPPPYTALGSFSSLTHCMTIMRGGGGGLIQS